MSEATIDSYVEPDTEQDFDAGEDDQDFLAQLANLFGTPQVDEALRARFNDSVDAVTTFQQHVSEHGSNEPNWISVGLSEWQTALVLDAIGCYVRDIVPDNADGVGDKLLDVVDALMAKIHSSSE